MESSPKDLNHVGIVGLGLIGGSLGLDLQSLGCRVYGLTHRESTAQRAKERGLAQVASTDPNILLNCSVVILALPLSQLVKPSKELINILPANAIITDVGSVKAPITKVWNKIHPLFVPSHPMAGTSNAGIEAGERNLFKNRPWVTTPSKETNQTALSTIHELAHLLGSQLVSVDAEMHDQAVALISHLPIFISAALLKTVGEGQPPSLLELAKTVASSGFADTTRIGAGNPNLGVDLAKYNHEALVQALSSYCLSIRELKSLIENNQWDQLQSTLKESKLSRSDFLE